MKGHPPGTHDSIGVPGVMLVTASSVVVSTIVVTATVGLRGPWWQDAVLIFGGVVVGLVQAAIVLLLMGEHLRVGDPAENGPPE